MSASTQTEIESLRIQLDAQARELDAAEQRVLQWANSCGVDHIERLQVQERELDAARAEIERLKKDNELASNELVEYAKLLAATTVTDQRLAVAERRLGAMTEAMRQIANMGEIHSGWHVKAALDALAQS